MKFFLVFEFDEEVFEKVLARGLRMPIAFLVCVTVAFILQAHNTKMQENSNRINVMNLFELSNIKLFNISSSRRFLYHKPIQRQFGIIGGVINLMVVILVDFHSCVESLYFLVKSKKWQSCFPLLLRLDSCQFLLQIDDLMSH